MHAVKVAVAGFDVWEGRMVGVGVGVLGSAGMVAVIGFVEVTWGVCFTIVAGEYLVEVYMGVILGCGRATDPQDVTRISSKQRTIKLLSTLAVYHKIYLVQKLLSPCEYVRACLPIHSFAGKIAEY